MKIKSKKMGPGFYVYEMETTIDGKPGVQDVNISYDDLLSVWICEMGVKGDNDGEHYNTKREALDAAKHAARDGWRWSRSLGYVIQ